MKQAPSRRVWITRTLPGAEATAERVAALGFTPLVAPLLAVKPLSVRLALDGVGALAFTSANGVRAFRALSSRRDLPAFAVGAGTARAARDAGFADVRAADGDVAALAAFIAGQPPIGGRLLHPTAREPAGDLAAGLAMPVEAVAVYETVASPSPATIAAAADSRIALIHSPKAAETLAAQLRRSPAPELSALCLSRAAARPLAGAGLAAVDCAPFPNEASLLKLLASLQP